MTILVTVSNHLDRVEEATGIDREGSLKQFDEIATGCTQSVGAKGSSVHRRTQSLYVSRTFVEGFEERKR